MKLSTLCYNIVCWLLLSVLPATNATAQLVLKKGNYRIIIDKKEAGPVQIAAQALRKDFGRVTKWEPGITNILDRTNAIDIIIVNEANKSPLVDSSALKPLDGAESHSVYVVPEQRRIYLHGKDMRGTIYAIYTFSEKFLGVPPLCHFNSWVPTFKKTISVPLRFNFFQQSPQTQSRVWSSNGNDSFIPWEQCAKGSKGLWMETVLRLKLNTVEADTKNKPKVQANLAKKYGVLLSKN